MFQFASKSRTGSRQTGKHTGSPFSPHSPQSSKPTGSPSPQSGTPSPQIHALYLKRFTSDTLHRIKSYSRSSKDDAYSYASHLTKDNPRHQSNTSRDYWLSYTSKDDKQSLSSKTLTQSTTLRQVKVTPPSRESSQSNFLGPNKATLQLHPLRDSAESYGTNLSQALSSKSHFLDKNKATTNLHHGRDTAESHGSNLSLTSSSKSNFLAQNKASTNLHHSRDPAESYGSKLSLTSSSKSNFLGQIRATTQLQPRKDTNISQAAKESDLTSSLQDFVAATRKTPNVDHKNFSQPPLDFSFREIKVIEDLIKVDDDVVQPRWYVLHQPDQCKELERAWSRRMSSLHVHLKEEEKLRMEGQKPIPKLDMWKHIEVGDFETVLGAARSRGAVSTDSLAQKDRDLELPRLPTQFLRLNNNNMETIQGFGRVVRLLLVDPTKLSWLDLSFNKLRDINSETCQFKNLKSLYLHGNKIADVAEVEKLSGLTKLITLTLHGNPFSGLDNYQAFVISTLPWIKTLDFVVVTPDTKGMARRWDRVCGKSKIKAQGKLLHQFEEKMRKMEEKD